ncbi:hypothetical protein BGZ46_006160 [Entomortierella lignicola]|nr:hypothetical protein BGZ46_006160 [Entomortierella lignicola]
MVTIQELDFSKCENVSSAMVRDLLANCPNLTSFSANKIELEDAVHGKPWVCERLRKLALYFDFGDPSNSCHVWNSRTWVHKERNIPKEDLHIVYSRLARLTQLETLDLQRHFHPKLLIQKFRPPATMYYPPTLRLQLSEGLELLSTLKRLRKIFIQDMWRNIKLEEALWIRENWPELEAIDIGWNAETRPKEVYSVITLGSEALGRRIWCGWNHQ